MISRISIGTVNFGIPYGAGLDRLQVAEAEAERILEHAFDKGITHLDTAVGYGDAEEVVGRCISSIKPVEVNITSKLLPLGAEEKRSNIVSLLCAEAEKSCERLKVPHLERCLLHKASDLYGEFSDQVCRALVELKRTGLVKKVGVSAYTQEELSASLSLGLLDVVQVPFSVADQRLLRSGMLEHLNDADVEVDVRSVFLQGVLLQAQGKRHPMFNVENGAIALFLERCRYSGLTPLQACLGYALQLNSINHTVVGVQSVKQLETIIKSTETEFNSWEIFRDCAWTHEDLLNPSNWHKLGAD
ncbi:aldo/keto reductase [Thalassospira sp.]|uniref:aldo/keto reductase n=1 Tax=Thalassospira sp. TaxID=1912094 RepID=UPI001B2EB478|nr:aldo/keto reductase [Thalassospira sp.]MBO6805976.1 aldo/keto reductase [Thalassospira sp.]